MSDLLVLVADAQTQATLETLLAKRREALGIREIAFRIERHRDHDSGVYHQAHTFLHSQRKLYAKFLIVWDEEWHTGKSPLSAEAQAQKVAENLRRNGFAEEDFCAIVISPELEAWVWGSSAKIPEVLRSSREEIKALGASKKLWDNGELKPRRPKELLEAVLRQQKRPSSSAIFKELAEKVSFKDCEDAAFQRFRATLQKWFPAER